MSAGAGLTLWAVRQFGVGETARPQVGEASPTPRSEPGVGVPGAVPQASAIATQLSHDGQFRFALQGCRRSEGNVMCELQIIVISNNFATFAFTCKPCPGRGYSDDQCLKVLHFPVKRL